MSQRIAAPDVHGIQLFGSWVRLVAFDLDGTLYFGDRIAEGALELVRLLGDRGVEVVFFTNSSAKSRAAILEKLVKMGFPAIPGNTVTSGSATAAYVCEAGYTRVAVLGTTGLCDEIELTGIEIVEGGPESQALVIGLVPDFAVEDRFRFLDSLPNGCPLVACNMDASYPVEGGARKPGCGAMVKAVEERLGRRVDAVVGKPGTYMLRAVCRDARLTPAEVLVVGDSEDSDIAMAKAASAPWVLIDSAAQDVVVAEGCATVRDLRDLIELISGSADKETV
ncbi:MAG: HAD-IIA family hydrolase [Coriobacteriia bacterium]